LRGGRKPRLGADFGRLWLASAVTNVGDGVTLAAGPLLVASLTDDPALVGAAVFAQQLPWLLFSLISGAYVDRLDRRRLVVAVNLFRGAVIGGLAVAVWADAAGLVLVYLTFFLLGTAETLADNASIALLPATVAKDQLSRANARLVATHLVGNQLVGPPFGAWLFVLVVALPFGFNAATFVVAALLIATLRWRPAADAPAPSRRSLRSDIGEGVRWLWGHRAMRTLAVSICLMNITFMSAFAILVLYARERLGLDEVGYGWLLAAVAVGGLIGSAVVSRLEERFGAPAVLRIGFVIETLTHLVLALTTTWWVAELTLVVFGVHAAVMGVIMMSVRQRVVPEGLLGRVQSVYYLFSIGGSALGALLGGVLARALGITGPFWVAFVVMTLFTAAVWRVYTASAFASPPAEPART
jgi:MFS family permease